MKKIQILGATLLLSGLAYATAQAETNATSQSDTPDDSGIVVIEEDVVTGTISPADMPAGGTATPSTSGEPTARPKDAPKTSAESM